MKPEYQDYYGINDSPLMSFSFNFGYLIFDLQIQRKYFIFLINMDIIGRQYAKMFIPKIVTLIVNKKFI